MPRLRHCRAGFTSGRWIIPAHNLIGILRRSGPGDGDEAAPIYINFSEYLMSFTSIHYDSYPLAQIAKFPDLNALYCVWQAGAEQGNLPDGIDVLDIPKTLLPYTALLETDAQCGLRFRVAGSAICNRVGRELRGVCLSDAFGIDGLAQIQGSLRHVIEDGVPDFAFRSFRNSNNLFWSYVRLILPLSRHGAGTDRLLVAIDPSTLVEKHIALNDEQTPRQIHSAMTAVLETSHPVPVRNRRN